MADEEEIPERVEVSGYLLHDARWLCHAVEELMVVGSDAVDELVALANASLSPNELAECAARVTTAISRHLAAPQGASPPSPALEQAAAACRQGLFVQVEVEHGSATSWDRAPEKAFLLRASRAERSVVLAWGLSRPVAEHLAASLRELLGSGGLLPA